jgi:hypothetical protein
MEGLKQAARSEFGLARMNEEAEAGSLVALLARQIRTVYPY